MVVLQHGLTRNDNATKVMVELLMVNDQGISISREPS